MRYAMILMVLAVFCFCGHAVAQDSGNDSSAKSANTSTAAQGGWKMSTRKAGSGQTKTSSSKVEVGKCIAGIKYRTPSGNWRCKCPQGKQYDAEKEKCKVWYDQPCAQASQCHPAVPMCKKGFGGGSLFGKNQLVCVNKTNFYAWSKNAFIRENKAKPTSFTLTHFDMGRFASRGKSAVRQCGYKYCWKAQPVRIGRANNKAQFESFMQLAAKISKLGANTCRIKVYGVVDKNWKRMPKPRANEESRRSIHRRLADLRWKSMVKYIEDAAEEKGLKLNIVKPAGIRERTKIAGKRRGRGEDRKAIITVNCDAPYTIPSPPGRPGQPPSPTINKTSIVNKTVVKSGDGGGLGYFPLSFEVYGTGYIPTGAFVTKFSLTGGLKINLQFVEWFAINGFAGGGYSIQYAGNGRPFDVSWGFGVTFIPLPWLEIPAGFMSYGAGSTGDSVDFWEVHHTFFTGVDFVISPSERSYVAFVLGVRLHFLDVYQRFFEKPEARFGGFSAYLALRFRFPRKQKK